MLVTKVIVLYSSEIENTCSSSGSSNNSSSSKCSCTDSKAIQGPCLKTLDSYVMRSEKESWRENKEGYL